jgi:hypothetical protein
MNSKVLRMPVRQTESFEPDARWFSSLADAICISLRIQKEDRGLTYVIGTGNEQSNRDAIRYWLRQQHQSELTQDEYVMLMEQRLLRRLREFAEG